MSRNITKTYNRFKSSEKTFRCPICAAETTFRNENSLVCSSGHCFDLSKHGYINFMPNKSKTKYTKGLFESRRYIFQSGFYDPLKENIKCLIEEYMDASSNIRILDAGCGEGFFISDLLTGSGYSKEIFALDIFKEAIVLAARANHDINWVVGDLSNIPLQSNSVDVLLNVFSPANYGEFSRIMNDIGFMLKAVPGSRYLAELRECAGEQLINKEYSNEQVLRCFFENMSYLDKKNVFYQLPVTENHLENFIQMTPMMFNVDKAVIKGGGIKQITIDVDILIGKNANIP